MGYSSFSFQIPAGLEVNAPLTFPPLAAIVSNYSPFYIYFPDGLNFCPPWTSGAVIPLGHATQARASWLQSPFGIQTIPIPPAGVVYSATMTFSANPDMSPGGGTVIQNPYTPAKSVRASLTAVTAGNYPIVASNIPVGSVVSVVTLSGAITGGTVGQLYLLLTDGTVLLTLLNQIVSTQASNISLTLPSALAFPALSLSAPNWYMYFSAIDRVGINTFYGSSYIIYS